MIFLGHFVFDTFDEEQRVGYFNLLVDAKDVESAKERFRKRLLYFRGKGTLFSGNIKIYLDGIVELKKPPEEVILTNYRTFHGDAPPSIYNILPEQNVTGCEVHPTIPDKSTDTCARVEPFLEF